VSGRLRIDNPRVLLGQGELTRPPLQDVLLDGNELFKKFKGALTEQYVLQQLKTVKSSNLYYWTADRGTAEVDFVINTSSDVIPVRSRQSKIFRRKASKFTVRNSSPNLPSGPPWRTTRERIGY